MKNKHLKKRFPLYSYYNTMALSVEQRGFIRLYIGPMFSGKTSSLIEAYREYRIAGMKCLLVKWSKDTRFDEINVVSHNGQSLKSELQCCYLCEIDNQVNNYQVICIDEIQFFEDAPVFCDKWANQGLIIEASGLNGTYTRKEFPVISKLIPLAEEIYKKSAVVTDGKGKRAFFTLRTSSEKETIVVGGVDKYKPVDRDTFFNREDIVKEHEIDGFKNFIPIYCKKRNMSLTTNQCDCVIENFTKNYVKYRCYDDFITQSLKNFSNQQESIK